MPYFVEDIVTAVNPIPKSPGNVRKRCPLLEGYQSHTKASKNIILNRSNTMAMLHEASLAEFFLFPNIVEITKVKYKKHKGVFIHFLCYSFVT